MTAPLYLVTGATGALGPTVVQYLVEQGCRVRVLARRSPAAGLLPAAVEVCYGDLSTLGTLAAAVSGVDCVFHLAAFLHVANPSPAQQLLYRTVNVRGTHALVDAAQGAGVRRLVYFSTIAVYGPDRAGLLAENAAPQPDTPYARSKLAGEELVLAARRGDGRPLGTVLRLAAVYGPRLKGNYRRLLEALARRRFVPVGPGRNLRTLVYDADAAAAAFLAARAPQAAGRVYNVTDGQVHTLHAVLDAMCQALGRPYPRVGVPAWAVTPLLHAAGSSRTRWGAALAKYCETAAVDGSRLQAELGFRPAFDLQTGWAAVANTLYPQEGICRS